MSNLIKCDCKLMQITILRSVQRSILRFRSNLTLVNTPIRLLERHPSYTVSTCNLRTRSSSNENKEKSENGEEKEEESKSNEGNDSKIPKLDPAQIRKLRIYVLIVGGLSFGTSFFLLSKMYKEGSGMPQGASYEHFSQPGIEFNVFIQKYLKTGEVRAIVFCPQTFKAVAYLHDGAVIDGQRAKENYVVISYTGTAQQFWADIRKEEGLMGISVTNGCPISVYQGMTGWKVVELLIGVAIIAFLGTQYVRLLRQRVLANKKQGPKKE